MLTRVQKEEQVKVLRDKVVRANAVIALDYRGMTVDDANALRAKLRALGKGGVEYRVAKNTLLRIATRGTALEAIERHLSGPTAVALSYDEPAAVAKVLTAFAKDNEKLKIKGAVVDGEALDAKCVAQLASLPSKLELRAQLAGMVQAPLRNLAGTLQSLLGQVRNALEARAKQLEAQ